MFRDDGSGAKPSARQKIAERVKKANEFFARPAVQKAIEASSKETLRWLQENKRSFNKHTEYRNPWWIELPATDDKILLDARKRMMESSCFENGLRKFYDLLVESRVGFPEDYRTLKKAVDYRAIAVHYQLAAFCCVNHPPLKLAEMARRFDYGAPAKLRDAMLAQMAELGLWYALVGKEEHEPYALSIGPVAWAFHVNALFPAIQHFSQSKFLGKKE